MILKRQEKDGKIKGMYSSSTICASIFDTATKDLTVIFNNGGRYKYPQVEQTDYMRFETADSHGSAFNTHIKKKYTNFEKLEKVTEEQLKNILTEVTELKEAEDKAALSGASKALVGSCLSAATEFVKSGVITPATLEQLEAKIALYKKITTPQEEPVTA